MVLGRTKSLCPWCLTRIDAERVAEADGVYLRKVCPEHGEYKTIIWRGTAESFIEWGDHAEGGSCCEIALTPVREHCPFDCGLCPAHTGGICVVLMEVTNRCNIRCPICFSGSSYAKADHEPNLAAVEGMYRAILSSGGPAPLQLSGGEPTLRDDLPEIVAIGKRMGFDMIQINTNGIRFAEDNEYLAKVRERGASTLYLQFDGLTDDIYSAIRGTPLVDVKAKVLENCRTLGLGVVLVVVLVPGINDHQIGAIIRFAKEWVPVVRGVHFQPISYFGRYPHAPNDEDRITLPEVLAALERQTGGEVAAADFKPKRNKEGHCSFAGFFVLGDDGVLRSTFSRGTVRNTTKPDAAVRQFLQNYWSPAGSNQCACSGPCQNPSQETIFGDLVKWVQTRSLTISGMPFQDAWNIDLARLEGCCIHVVTSDNHLVPFCARYLTGSSGDRLYE